MQAITDRTQRNRTFSFPRLMDYGCDGASGVCYSASTPAASGGYIISLNPDQRSPTHETSGTSEWGVKRASVPDSSVAVPLRIA